MPTNKQRREAERRRLQRQAQQRQRRSAHRRRVNLVVSIVGAIVILAIVVVFIVATTNDDKTPTATKGTPARTTSAAVSATESSRAPSKSPSGSHSESPTTSRSKSPSKSPSKTPSTAESTSPGTATSSTAPVAPVGKTVQCTYTPSGVKAARAVTRPPTKAAASGTITVAIMTSQGPMTFTLNRAKAPCTVNSFVSLARQKYYNATPCHRLVTRSIYVTQCGDPTGTGRGGPGYTFDDELTGHEKYTPGVLAMANGGANSNGSQFFIVYKTSQLGPQYTIFGHVSSGLSTVDKVAAAGTADGSTDGKPKLPFTIRTATVAS